MREVSISPAWPEPVGARLLDRVELRRHHLPPRGAPYPRLRVHLLQILLRHEIYHSRRQRATRHRPRRERCLSPLLGDADLSILEAPRQMKKVIEEALRGIDVKILASRGATPHLSGHPLAAILPGHGRPFCYTGRWERYL